MRFLTVASRTISLSNRYLFEAIPEFRFGIPNALSTVWFAMLSKEIALHGLMAAVALMTVLHTRNRLQRDLEDMRWRLTIHALTVRDTYGSPVPLQRFAGQVMLIVNIASK